MFEKNGVCCQNSYALCCGCCPPPERDELDDYDRRMRRQRFRVRRLFHGIRGLENPNHCGFANSVMQCLVNIPAFVQIVQCRLFYLF